MTRDTALNEYNFILLVLFQDNLVLSPIYDRVSCILRLKRIINVESDQLKTILGKAKESNKNVLNRNY